MKKIILSVLFLSMSIAAMAGNYPNFPLSYTGMVAITGTARSLGTPDNPMSINMEGANVTVSVGTVSLTGTVKVQTLDAIGNTNGGLYNPYFSAMSGYPSTALNLFDNTALMPMFISPTTNISSVITNGDTTGNTYGAQVYYDGSVSVDFQESMYSYSLITSAASASSSYTVTLLTPTAGNRLCIREITISTNSGAAGEAVYLGDTISASTVNKWIAAFYPIGTGIPPFIMYMQWVMPIGYPLNMTFSGLTAGEIVYVMINYKMQPPNSEL